jgi:hypothetical protein
MDIMAMQEILPNQSILQTKSCSNQQWRNQAGMFKIKILLILILLKPCLLANSIIKSTGITSLEN